MRVELGSGYQPHPDFDVHLDLSPACRPTACADVLRLPCATGSVTELRAVDVLEHVSYRRTDVALVEWARVLRPRGKLFVQVPDAESIMEWFVRSNYHPWLRQGVPDDLTPRGPLAWAEWRLMGGQEDGVYARDGDDWRFNAHHSLWSPSMLKAALDRAGLDVERCEVNPFPNVQCWAVKR